MEKKRVLIINAILYTAETDQIPKVTTIKDTMIYTLCLGFLKNGDEPVLIAAKDYKPLEEEEYPFQILFMDCKLKKLCKPRYLPWLKGLAHYIKQNKKDFDLIISSEVFSLLSLTSVLCGKEKTVIWHELGAHNKMMKKIPSKIWYNLIPRLFMRGVKIMPRSIPAKAFIGKYCDSVAEHIIDHGVDIEKIGYDTKKEDYFVVLSQLIARKQIDGIIRKFHEFSKGKNKHYQLKIIGDGEEKQALQQLVEQLGMGNQVLFYGKQTHAEIAPVLMKAKGLLVNTRKDNSMVSIVESIAAGTPVLTTEVPFNASYIQKEHLGIAKNDWGKEQLQALCDENAKYVDNCVNYRYQLSNKFCAEQFKALGITRRN